MCDEPESADGAVASLRARWFDRARERAAQAGSPVRTPSDCP
jgi:hypothetical protein